MPEENRVSSTSSTSLDEMSLSSTSIDSIGSEVEAKKKKTDF